MKINLTVIISTLSIAFALGQSSDALPYVEKKSPVNKAPAPCLFYDYKVDTAGVFLGLLPSSSGDVVKYKLYRKSNQESKWSVIQKFDSDPPEIYLDNTVTSAGKYSYKWIAIDAEGLESSADHSMLHLDAMDMRTFYRPSGQIKEIDDGEISLTIDNKIPGRNYRFQILRSLAGGKFVTVSTLRESRYYSEKLIKKSGEKIGQVYRIRVLYDDGLKSKFSEILSLP